MTLSANFTSKSVFDQQGCRALTFALARLSCLKDVRQNSTTASERCWWSNQRMVKTSPCLCTPC